MSNPSGKTGAWNSSKAAPDLPWPPLLHTGSWRWILNVSDGILILLGVGALIYRPNIADIPGWAAPLSIGTVLVVRSPWTAIAIKRIRRYGDARAEAMHRHVMFQDQILECDEHRASIKELTQTLSATEYERQELENTLDAVAPWLRSLPMFSISRALHFRVETFVLLLADFQSTLDGPERFIAMDPDTLRVVGNFRSFGPEGPRALVEATSIIYAPWWDRMKQAASTHEFVETGIKLFLMPTMGDE